MTQMWNEIWEQPMVLERCLISNSKVIEEIVKAINSGNINSVVISARGTSDQEGN